MTLDTDKAQRLFESVVEAAESRTTTQPVYELLNFLIKQLEELRVLANGYPRSSINGDVWVSGKALAVLCDNFTDLLSAHNFPKEEELASSLAVGMALQVMSHYPEEIFPRIVRNALCQEKIGGTDRAIDLYDSVIGDFQEMRLDELPSDIAELTESDRLVLTAVLDAVERLSALRPDRADELKGLEATLKRFRE